MVVAFGVFSTSTFGQVNLYANPAALTGASAPTQTIVHPTISAGVQRAVLSADGTLYVGDDDGVSIFRNALTAPTFVVELTTGSVNDLLLVE